MPLSNRLWLLSACARSICRKPKHASLLPSLASCADTSSCSRANVCSPNSHRYTQSGADPCASSRTTARCACNRLRRRRCCALLRHSCCRVSRHTWAVYAHWGVLRSQPSIAASSTPTPTPTCPGLAVCLHGSKRGGSRSPASRHAPGSKLARAPSSLRDASNTPSGTAACLLCSLSARSTHRQTVSVSAPSISSSTDVAFCNTTKGSSGTGATPGPLSLPLPISSLSFAAV
mmetsp:Transcript_15657/g.34601  ORF Transcript_15657/g.34601 Transcript_15657/m.34601 type:complete len:232 (+) Transcript_15657:717-1412(+)